MSRGGSGGRCDALDNVPGGWVRLAARVMNSRFHGALISDDRISANADDAADAGAMMPRLVRRRQFERCTSAGSLRDLS